MRSERSNSIAFKLTIVCALTRQVNNGEMNTVEHFDFPAICSYIGGVWNLPEHFTMEAGKDSINPSLQVNNVGTNIRNPTEKFTEADYSKIMSTNLESAFFITQQAYPLLKASGNASVVMVSSIAGVVAIRTGSIYAMTKGQQGFLHSAQCLALV